MDEPLWYQEVSLPALLRHARTAYGSAMRRALEVAGYDIPGNGLYVIGALALVDAGVPLQRLIRELGISEQGAGQLVDALVMRGYVACAADQNDDGQRVLTLTGQGRAAAATQTAARRDVDAALVAGVGAEDVASTRRALAMLVQMGRESRDGEDER